MYLDYETLKRYYDTGTKIGDWNDKEVYVSNSKELQYDSKNWCYIFYHHLQLFEFFE